MILYTRFYLGRDELYDRCVVEVLDINGLSETLFTESTVGSTENVAVVVVLHGLCTQVGAQFFQPVYLEQVNRRLKV